LGVVCTDWAAVGGIAVFFCVAGEVWERFSDACEVVISNIYLISGFLELGGCVSVDRNDYEELLG
jgi:hypothetical protein